MDQVEISPISALDEGMLAHLLEESLSQGFRLVQRLIQEYNDRLNCFDQPGEVLFLASAQSKAIGVGGLNQDPYFCDPHIGRLRHLYIATAWRRQGIGRQLVCQIIQAARPHHRLLTLRTDTAVADRFYRSLGFQTEPNWVHTTHHLLLSDPAYYP
ncbi:GNAT family N-acetyltransferase [Phormidium tenue FACHB-886]|nr:GNAT family N-acetyltransferase [Phormidium tenue FACHB-886]